MNCFCISLHVVVIFQLSPVVASIYLGLFPFLKASRASNYTVYIPGCASRLVAAMHFVSVCYELFCMVASEPLKKSATKVAEQSDSQSSYLVDVHGFLNCRFELSGATNPFPDRRSCLAKGYPFHWNCSRFFCPTSQYNRVVHGNSTSWCWVKSWSLGQGTWVLSI